MIQHCVIKVRGDVQGVGFRYHAQQAAVGLDITGYIRNNTDGSIDIEAEGGSEALEQFIAWCRQGPKFARVADVEFEYTDKVRNFSGFNIVP